MSLRLNGSTSGYVEIDAPAVAGTTSVTIPATTGELAVKATDGSVDLGGVNIDSSGRLLVGTTTSTNNVRLGQKAAFVSTGGVYNGVSLTSYAGTGAGTSNLLDFQRSRGTSDGSLTAVASNDALGYISWRGSDGSAFVNAASISAEVDGTPGANDMPGRLVFSTTQNGSSSPTERMRIAQNGLFYSYTDSTGHTLRTAASAGTTFALYQGYYGATGTVSGGTLSYRVWTNGNVINTNNSYGPISSDERLKQDIVDVGSQWDDIKGVRLTKFRYKNDPTGELQLGPIAQELEQVSPGLITRRPASEDEIADPSNSLVDGDEVLSFKASILYMKAVGALQEAMERIETLEAEVQALKGGN